MSSAVPRFRLERAAAACVKYLWRINPISRTAAIPHVPVDVRRATAGLDHEYGQAIDTEPRRLEAEAMARIIVTTEQGRGLDVPVLLDEQVCPDHLSDDHSAAQLIERLGWAVTDAEDAERDQQQVGGSNTSKEAVPRALSA
jgi:hypothetical protein